MEGRDSGARGRALQARAGGDALVRAFSRRVGLCPAEYARTYKTRGVLAGLRDAAVRMPGVACIDFSDYARALPLLGK